MKILSWITGLLICPVLLHAQILTPVKWSYSAKKLSGGEYALHMVAHIDKGWHIYALNAGNGPIPTSFQFKQSGTQTIGKMAEQGKLIAHFDKSFHSTLRYFENSVDFVQVVRVVNSARTVKGSLEYEVCNDTNCLPPKDIDFTIPL